MNAGIYERLFDEICRLPVIDTHEHLPFYEEFRQDDKRDLLGEYLSHYLSSDIISAGLNREDYQRVIDPAGDVAERWALVEPYWNYSRHTGYGRALDISVKAIYGINGINRHTVRELTELHRQSKKPGHMKRVLKDLCNIEVSLLDSWTFDPDKFNPLFKFIWQPMNFIIPSPPEGDNVLSLVNQKHGVSVKSLDDWLEALEAEMDFVLSHHGVRTIKSSIAYFRTLRFEKVSYDTAKSQFAEALKKWDSELRAEKKPMEFPRELQDFMMHSVLKLANRRNLTFQFHTGILEGNGNVLSNSDPVLLTNLFMEYPDVDFDLFHISYPYQGVASALGKMFPNVFVDMCWAHIISPSACVSALDDFLDAIPYNKISAFGGDYLFVDGVYGHLYLSRQNVARTLAGKVERGVFDEGRALEIARALYYDNPKRIFKLA